VVTERRARRHALARGLAGLALVAPSLASSSCASGLEWRVRFQNRSDASSTTVVEARVRRDTCDGEVVWRGTIAQGRALEGMGVPSLPSGRYALDVVAWDAECRPVASACDLVTSPFRGSVVVELASTPGPAACAPDACSGGLCDCSMGGCADAGAPDAFVSLDAGRDAFTAPDAFSPDDAGPPDAFEAPDAFIVPPAAPVVVAPWSGVTTGAPVPDAPLEDPPLRPEFLWEPVTGAGSYVVELYRCDRPDWRACALDVPTHVARFAGDVSRGRPSIDLPVSSAPPVGARYVFRVGACTTDDHRGCAFAEPRYLDVGRAASDLDGDGVGDLLVVATGDGMDPALYSVGLGASPSDAATLRSQFTQPSFGALAPVGDYDGDGLAEAVVSAPIAEPDAAGGRILYLDGVAAGGVVAGGDDRSGTAGAGLGARLVAIGDIDGDGYADFAANAPGISELRIYHGGSTFDPARQVLVRRPPMLDEFALDFCGAGDVDGDGRADLAVLSRGIDDTLTAQVRIYAQRDPAVRGVRELTEDIVRVATGFAEFRPDGSKYVELDCRGDVDGDGRPDIVVGQHRVSTVLVDPLVGPAFARSSPSSDAMGWGLALGDLDGTGRLSILASRTGLPGGRYTPNGTALLRFSPEPRGLSVTDYDPSFQLASAGIDYDSDGREDAVVRSTEGLRVYLDDGATVHVVPPPTGRTWSTVAY
jgi:hypothetical protein